MLAIDKNSLYEAFKAKDPRFDGRFFVGISSTAIYCRPVCRARQPKKENCSFFQTAAEAEKAGYRPCLLCRPELAPGTAIIDATDNLAQRAMRLLEKNCGTGQSLEKLAEELGCTDRHLRRVFSEKYNVSPIEYLQTCRLLLAKNLLTDTNLPILEVAMAAGFGSLRRFNDLFKNHYRLTPTALRKKMTDEKKKTGRITLTLGYRPPYPFKEILSFFAYRAIPGVEIVKEDLYLRTVHLQDAKGRDVYGWVKIGLGAKKNTLSLTASETLLPVLSQVIAKVRHLFDLYCEPQIVYETLQSMNEIRPGLAVLGIRLPGSFDAFETAVRAVLGQQITVKAARTLTGRFVEAFGKPIETNIDGLTHAFPSPKDILALAKPIENHLGPLGIFASRARTIYKLAEGLEEGIVSLNISGCPEKEIKKLLTIPGIGNWTAGYLAMRTMGWPDIFLETDAGVKKALGSNSPKELREMAEAWRPWRSYATINLWNSL